MKAASRVCEKVEANFIAAHSMCGSKLTTKEQKSKIVGG